MPTHVIWDHAGRFDQFIQSQLDRLLQPFPYAEPSCADSRLMRSHMREALPHRLGGLDLIPLQYTAAAGHIAYCLTVLCEPFVQRNRAPFAISANVAAGKVAFIMGNDTITASPAIAKILPADIAQIGAAGFARSFWLRHPKCHIQSVITSAISDSSANALSFLALDQTGDVTTSDTIQVITQTLRSYHAQVFGCITVGQAQSI